MSNPIRHSLALRLTLRLACLGFLLAPFSAQADSGFYIGGSIGSASIETDLEDDPSFPDLPSEIDEDDTGYKILAGVKWDNPLIDLGIEGAYVDFGKPRVNIPQPTIGGSAVEFDPTGVSVFGVAGFDVGPIDLFAKVGYLFWDIEASIAGFPGSVSDDGSDIGYGLGAGFNLGSLQIRGEWELFDIDDADVSMLSVGVVYQF